MVTKGPITYNGSQYLVKYGAGEWIVEGAITGNEGVTDYLGVTEGILRLRAGADVKLFSGVNSVGNFGYNGTSGGVIIEAGAEMSLPALLSAMPTIAPGAWRWWVVSSLLIWLVRVVCR